ncbi:MAG: hypothetical protein OXC72_08140, partial [Roseovarius sp.]|nr:hypothetical protein [Roseovarius sp.]
IKIPAKPGKKSTKKIFKKPRRPLNNLMKKIAGITGLWSWNHPTSSAASNFDLRRSLIMESGIPLNRFPNPHVLSRGPSVRHATQLQRFHYGNRLAVPI